MLINALQQISVNWTPPVLPKEMPSGDVLGDIVNLSEGVIRNANTLFPALTKAIMEKSTASQCDKIVIAITGGSGSGKSCIGSILCHYFREAGIGTYILSGDNYPRRIPYFNDAERERVFRTEGIKGLLEKELYTDDVRQQLDTLWANGSDSDPKEAQKPEYAWLKVYQAYGRKRLAQYLGTEEEQDYDELSHILAQFHAGKEQILLKRMGRSIEALYYEAVDFSNVQILLLEWTHGNSASLTGVDIPVLLNSTPDETREYRRLRGRDGNTDSAFVTMVLEIEQKKIHDRADAAGLILSKDGVLLTKEEYHQLMDPSMGHSMGGNQ